MCACGVIVLVLPGVAASATTRGVPAPVRTPGNVADGLVLWLDASDPSGTGTRPAAGEAVAQWVDKSGAGNHATVNTRNPRNTAAFFDPEAEGFNGRPALRFDRVNDAQGSVYTTANLDIRATSRPELTIMTVYRPTANVANNGLWGNDNGNWDRFFLAFHPAFGDRVKDGVVSLGPVLRGETVPKSALIGQSHLMTVGYSGNVVNGVNTGTTNASFVYFNCQLQRSFTDSSHATDAMNTMSVGWDGDNSVFSGYIAELIVYQRALDPSEIEAVNRYLATKYEMESGCADFVVPGLDIDGDGIADADGVSEPENIDTDTDADGVPNVDDPDIDNDGVPNSTDPDIDGDGILNEADSDMDGDGVPNERDLDDDGDALPDLEEGLPATGSVATFGRVTLGAGLFLLGMALVVVGRRQRHA